MLREGPFPAVGWRHDEGSPSPSEIYLLIMIHYLAHWDVYMFGFCRRRSEARTDSPRYVSSLQKDISKYLGMKREDVESDYRAKKSVHTIVTIGYLEYIEDVLALTDKGRMLMQNVSNDEFPKQ